VTRPDWILRPTIWFTTVDRQRPAARMGARVETALEDLGVTPSAVLFLDDIHSNVSAARTVGLQAEVAADPEEARAVLERYGIFRLAP
jgi:methionine salvage enolase-phosphatase E1